MCNDRLAFALSSRLAALFGLSGPLPAVDTDVFGDGAGPLAERQLDSLDLVELAVTVEDELGLRLSQNDLTDVRSIHGLATLVGIRVRGVMTMASFTATETELHRTFAEARDARQALMEAGHPAEQLSMGMSNDYEIAVEEGATMVRLGTTLFGARAK